MMRHFIRLMFAVSAVTSFALDTGHGVIRAAEIFEKVDFWAQQNRWVRVHGVKILPSGNQAQTDEKGAKDAVRKAMAKLRANELQACALLRWPQQAGNGKDGGENAVYLPVDLREAYENGRVLGAMYSDLVDAWELDNEPDLGFVPEAAERYSAFLKATYLGLKAGSKELRTEDGRLSAAVGQKRASLVLMGALGLPPGPWLERFAANAGFNYTDGFNYHYYGYAEDFTAVYKQHEAAAMELSTLNTQLSTAVTKALPIFLTEVGYGMLGKQARDTKEGRLRQWRWFKSVGEQATELKIEAPMAFYLPPYLEYDTLEFGLTVPAKPAVKSEEQGGESRTPTSGRWTAGGITYIAIDFGAHAAEPWMTIIGKEIGGNQITPALAEWVGQRTRSRVQEEDSRSWTVATAPSSPVVIDFLAGEDLQPLKRYNGTFVTGNVPPGMKPETGKPMLPPVVRPPKPLKPPRSEEFMIHVRTANGNLFEVYPTRMATPEWQIYLEQQGNFTMSFYGRAELPWRFKDNKPVSLVVVMYPKQLPATYEFKRVQLIRLGEAGHEKAQKNAIKPALNRYGQGKVVLYNFSDKPVTGELLLPEILAADLANKSDGEQSVQSVAKDLGPITLAPGERREVSVVIRVGAARFERNKAPITFVPDDNASPARFVTEFFPALEGLKTTVVAALLQQKPEAGNLKPESSAGDTILTNREIISSRSLATEEAKGILQLATGFLAQQGAKIERTSGGFTVTVTGVPPGKEQRVEVEIPWPDGLGFGEDLFLSLDYRLSNKAAP